MKGWAARRQRGSAAPRATTLTAEAKADENPSFGLAGEREDGLAVRRFRMNMPSAHDRAVRGPALPVSTRLLQALMVLSLGAGCTEFEAGSDVLPGTEANLLEPSDPRWSCLSASAERPPTPFFSGAAGRVIASFQVLDLTTGQLYPNARIRACGLADVTCENPVTDWFQVDSSGWVDLPLYQGYTGFLEVESPGEMVPYLLYMTEPLTGPITEYPLGAISAASLLPLLQLVGLTYVPGSGLIALRIFDCQGNTAAGASVSSELDAVSYYFVDGLPSVTAAETDEGGVAGFVNLPPRVVVIDVTAPNGLSIAGPQSFAIRSGWLSGMFVRPPGVAPRAPD
jgi:hypothetical protein